MVSIEEGGEALWKWNRLLMSLCRRVGKGGVARLVALVMVKGVSWGTGVLFLF